MGRNVLVRKVKIDICIKQIIDMLRVEFGHKTLLQTTDSQKLLDPHWSEAAPRDEGLFQFNSRNSAVERVCTYKGRILKKLQPL